MEEEAETEALEVVFLWASRPTNRNENWVSSAVGSARIRKFVYDRRRRKPARVVVTLDELRPWWCLIRNAWLDQ
jgi:hypothetical protein